MGNRAKRNKQEIINNLKRLIIMKKISIILVLLTIGLSAVTFGQTSTDSITMKKVFDGRQFYQGEKRLNMNQLVKTMQPNE